jgi:hypothetical protein
MKVRNIDIWRSAKQLMDQHPATALPDAVSRATEAGKVKDGETEAVWLGIAKAIRELQKKTPDDDLAH